MIDLAGIQQKPAFMARGACVGEDPALFYPERGQKATKAKAICAACSVREECLTFALTSPVEAFGVWGGKSENERWSILGEAKRRSKPSARLRVV